MSGFVRNAISRLAVVLESPVFSQSLPILMLLSLANICKIRGGAGENPVYYAFLYYRVR